MCTDKDLELGQLLWDFHVQRDVLEVSDLIFVMGSIDLSVPRYAIELYKEGLAPYILFSGGLGNFTEGVFDRPEAEIFAQMARDAGVPESAILVEPASKNSGENVQLSRALLKQQGLQMNSLIAVQKPIMGKRVLATLRKQWPEVQALVTSEMVEFRSYQDEHFKTEDVIHVMVGDLQRILAYPKLGFQSELEVPQHVIDAYHALIASGYVNHMMSE